MGLTTLSPSFADCLEIWGPQPPVTSGLSRSARMALHFFIVGKKSYHILSNHTWFKAKFKIILKPTLLSLYYLFVPRDNFF